MKVFGKAGIATLTLKANLLMNTRQDLFVAYRLTSLTCTTKPITTHGKTAKPKYVIFAFEDKLIFDNDIIKGWAGEVALDDSERTIFLHWERVEEPDMYLYEMIQISDCGNFRSRVWQWIKGGQTIRRTLIDEQRVSLDWAGH